MAKRRTAAAIAADMEVLRTELSELDAVEEPTDEQVTRAEVALEEFEALELERAAAADYEARMEVVRSASLAPGGSESGDGARFGAPQVMRRVDPFDVLNRSTFGQDRGELRRSFIDANLKAVEGRDLAGADNERHFEAVIRRHGSDLLWAQNILERSRPEYESAWAKIVMGRPEQLTDIERTALSSGSNTNGGYLIPTHLDPTIILTNSGSSNVMRQHARVVTLTEGTTWNGVTSAGVTASWDGELAEVSDDSPTFGRVSIPTTMAQALVQASIPSTEDITGLGSDIMMMFADAKDRLEGAAHISGTGSGQPKGIVTALDASTTVEITSTTAATIGEVDIHALYRGVPVRWRNNGKFMANPLYTLAVKRLGTAVSSAYSGDLTMPVSERWLGRPVVESDDMPTTQTTTALDNEIIYGDFSNYLIVDKPGSMSVEYIPHLFNTTNNLPDGRRAWYARWRTGADATNILAFRILQDKTST